MLKTFDYLIEKFSGLFILLLIATALRIPAFFEPHWYGDEGIYLTIGHGLNQGKVLYEQIVDHKTPIIYYLARVGTQLNFRILLAGWMLFSYASFYFLGKKLLKNPILNWLSCLSLIIVTSLPTLEGLIPNGELFVMGFILAGLLALSQTQYWRQYFSPSTKESQISNSRRSSFYLGLAGVFFGLGILTKVPAVFDVLAMFLLGWFGFFNLVKIKKTNFKKNTLLFADLLKNLGLLGLATGLPIILSAVYFIFKGAGKSYLEYGLLYNFHYTGTWVPETTSWLSSVWLPLSGKLVITFGFLIFLSLLKDKISPLVKWSAGWSSLALVATTLSNRPYPHYLLQLALPLILLFASLGQTCLQKKHRLLGSITVGLLLIFTIMVGKLINFWGYDSVQYYKNFYQLAAKKISYPEYAQNFNQLVADNALAAQVISQAFVKEIYIWGTNPMLYAQTKTTPSEKFLVLFHIQDLHLIDQAVKNVISARPPFIVVMKDAEKPPLTLTNFINKHYLPTQNFHYFTLWQIRK